MKRSLLFAVLGLVLVFGVVLRAHYEPRYQRIVAFGDSLVAGQGSAEGGGFPTFLARDLGQPVMNLGHSGDTTALGLAKLPAVIAEKPDITILLLGGNDFLTGVSEREIFKNLGRIIEGLKKSGSKVILLGLDSEEHGTLDRVYFDTLVAESKVAYVPNILDGIWGHPELMSDALHPNDAGYRLMAERIEPVLEKMLR